VADIQLLASQGLVQRDELIRLYQAIQGQLGKGPYVTINPTTYDGKFQAVLQAVVW
jgi:hypothetical protein